MAQKKKTNQYRSCVAQRGSRALRPGSQGALTASKAPNDDPRAAVERLRLIVEECFGCSPEHVVSPLHRAVEAFNWLGALFECIEEANADGDRSRSSGRILALASLGAYIAADYQVSIIGEPADEMQARIEATLAGGAV